MNDYAGLNELTPLIIKYPFEQLIKAIINIKLRHKTGKSVGTVLAFITGNALGFTFPGVGYFIVFVLNLLFNIPVNSVILSGVSMAVTMVLISSLLIYINKKIFQSYNKSKYGFSNTDWLFTLQDREILRLSLRDNDQSLSDEQIKQNIFEIEQRFKFLIEKIRIYKVTKQNDKRVTAKYALQSLRRGELSIFLDSFEDDYLKRAKRIENLKKGKFDLTSSSETVKEDKSPKPNSIKSFNSKDTPKDPPKAPSKAKPKPKANDSSDEDEKDYNGPEITFDAARPQIKAKLEINAGLNNKDRIVKNPLRFSPLIASSHQVKKTDNYTKAHLALRK